MQKEMSIVFRPDAFYNSIAKAKWYLCRGDKMLFVKNNPKRALKYINKGLSILPNDDSLLVMQGLCKTKLEYTELASLE